MQIIAFLLSVALAHIDLQPFFKALESNDLNVMKSFVQEQTLALFALILETKDWYRFDLILRDKVTALAKAASKANLEDPQDIIRIASENIPIGTLNSKIALLVGTFMELDVPTIRGFWDPLRYALTNEIVNSQPDIILQAFDSLSPVTSTNGLRDGIVVGKILIVLLDAYISKDTNFNNIDQFLARMKALSDVYGYSNIDWMKLNDAVPKLRFTEGEAKLKAFDEIKNDLDRVKENLFLHVLDLGYSNKA